MSNLCLGAKAMKKFWIGCLFLLGTPQVLAIDDVLPLRSWRLMWSFMSLDADGYWNHLETRDDLNTLSPPREYESNRYTLRSEYGYSRNLTIITQANFVANELTGGPTAIKTDGFSHGYLGVRQRLNQPGRSMRFTTEYGVWFPIEADENELLPTGNDSVDWQVITSYAQDFFPTKGGFEMDFGYRFRAENPEDEIIFDTKLFFQVFKLGELHLNYNVLESQSDTGVDFSLLEYPDNRARKAYHIKYTRQIGRHWKVDVGYRKVLDGRNIFDTSGWQLSFEYWR